MEKMNLGTTKNGFNVYSIVDDKHMLAHPVEEEDLEFAVRKIELKPPFGFYTVVFGEPIGFDNCVETEEGDDIRMECREGRDLPSRVVYGKEPTLTNLVTIGICTDDDGKETVFTAFYGQMAPKELSDPRLTDEERPEAEAFWAKHALVVQEEPGEMALEIETDDCYCHVHLGINGIKAEMDHFGKKSVKAKWGHGNDPGCSCVWESTEPSKAICAKYHITEEQFREIAERIEEELEDFSDCCWCY